MTSVVETRVRYFSIASDTRGSTFPTPRPVSAEMRTVGASPRNDSSATVFAEIGARASMSAMTCTRVAARRS
ncbi:MAG: hypothetical protein EBS39_05340, partial [Gammaproteobacteria bacterium]|nr:hypothetical protein [Gammaproteobacteria bacterium]